MSVIESQVIEIEARPGLRLRLQQPLNQPTIREVCEEALGLLADILMVQQGVDPLSDLLYHWSINTLRINLDDCSERTAVERLGAKISELLPSILDPICDSPFEMPVCFHGWVLEKSILAYLDTFDSHRVENVDGYPVHQFAYHVTQWARGLAGRLVLQEAGHGNNALDLLAENQGSAAQVAHRQLRQNSYQGDALAVVSFFYRQMADNTVKMGKRISETIQAREDTRRYAALREAT